MNSQETTNINMVWSEPKEPDKRCRYNHIVCETPFGRFLLTWKGWKTYPGYGLDETPWNEVEYHGWNSIEEAKQWAEIEMLNRITACLKTN